MAPQSWATSQQQSFLLEHVEEFIECQNTGKLSTFWPKIQKLWYQTWPEAGMDGGPPLDASKNLGEIIKGRNKQLQNWYYNNRSAKPRGQARPQPFSLNVKPERSLTAIQLYSNQNYETIIKPSVMAEIKEKKVPKQQILGIIKRHTAEKFSLEPIEVQQQFVAEAKGLKRKRAEEREKSSKKHVSEADVESYAAEVNNLPVLLQSMVSELGKRTGWAFMVVAGGPDPSTGKLRTVGAYEGRDMQGHTFAKFHPNFEHEVIKPFANFIKQVYPLSVRQARIVTPMPSGSGNIARDVAETNVALADQVTAVEILEQQGPEAGTQNDNEDSAEPHSCDLERENVEGERNSDENWTGRLDPRLRLPATITSDAGIHSPTPPAIRSPTPPRLTAIHSPIPPPIRSPTPPAPPPIGSSTPPVFPGVSQSQSETATHHADIPREQSNPNIPRGQRQRRPAASKEIVPLTSRTAHLDSSIWVQASYECLIEGAYGCNWSRCVDAWLEFENKLPLAEFSANRLPAIQTRPKELSQWLMKRNLLNPLQISDIERYSEQLTTWWTAMQAGTKKNAGRSLQHLRRGGPNGIVTFLFGVRWWRLNMNEPPQLDEWDTIVKQVTEMLATFVNC